MQKTWCRLEHHFASGVANRSAGSQELLRMLYGDGEQEPPQGPACNTGDAVGVTRGLSCHHAEREEHSSPTDIPSLSLLPAGLWGQEGHSSDGWSYGRGGTVPGLWHFIVVRGHSGHVASPG